MNHRLIAGFGNACWSIAITFGLIVGCGLAALPQGVSGDEPTEPKKSAQPDAEYIRKLIPEKILGEYKGGKLNALNVAGRPGYVIEPTGPVDPQRRWIWIFPFWLGIHDGHGVLHHRWYVERYLAKGFHVAGINVGTSCGSPKGADACQAFYALVRKQFDLDPRARLLVQSNGGLIGYGWAMRHPGSVERIGGICPATDFRTWPGLANVINFPDKGLDYGLTLAELTERVASFNPVDQLTPLARRHVRLLHIHGDADDVVPMKENSTELARRYTALGGSAKIVVIERLGHGGQVLYESQPLLDFLLDERESLGLEDVATRESYVLRLEVWGIEEEVDDGQAIEEKLLRSVELLVEPNRPFFGKSDAKGVTLDVRGKLVTGDDPAKVTMTINATLRNLNEQNEGELGIEEKTQASTTVAVTPGKSVVLGGFKTQRESTGKPATREQLRLRLTLLLPCVRED